MRTFMGMNASDFFAEHGYSMLQTVIAARAT